MLLCNSYVEELPHCRDILANFLIAHITKMAPIKASYRVSKHFCSKSFAIEHGIWH